jgi:hypothetical protein
MELADIGPRIDDYLRAKVTSKQDVGIGMLPFYAGVLRLKKLKSADFDDFRANRLSVPITEADVAEVLIYCSEYIGIINAARVPLNFFVKESYADSFLKKQSRDCLLVRLSASDKTQLFVSKFNKDSGWIDRGVIKYELGQWNAMFETYEPRYDVDGKLHRAPSIYKHVSHKNLCELIYEATNCGSYVLWTDE